MRDGPRRLLRSGLEPLVQLTRSLAVVGLFSLFAGTANATPQGHVALRTSICGAGDDALWQETRWCNGVTGDLLFGRERNRDFGLGPYVEVSSAGFWDARYGGGLSALLPVTSDFPLVLSLGAYGHETDSAALGGAMFFGLRSHNFHGSYNFATGLVVSGYRDLGAERATLVAIGLELDALLLAMPFLFLTGELR